MEILIYEKYYNIKKKKKLYLVLVTHGIECVNQVQNSVFTLFLHTFTLSQHSNLAQI